MSETVYTVGLAVDTSELQKGTQQARTSLLQLAQAESQLERQHTQTARALSTQARETATSAARLRDQARAAREARDVKLAESLNAQARVLSQQAREARSSAAATREQASASREAATAARAQQASMGGGLGGALRGGLSGGLGGGVTGALAGLVGGVAVSGIMMAIGALKSLMDNATSTATEMLNLQNRLTATAGSAAGGAREFQTVSGLANRLGVDIVELAGQYASFTAAIKGTTLEGNRGRVAFEQISAGLARMGLSSEATQRALQALQQMVSKGTVAAEELRGQWGEAVPGGFQIAARAMGVTTTELGKLSEQGKLTGTAMVESLGKQMAAETGPTLERVGSGATRLGNVLKELSATMLGPVVRATDKAQGSLATFLAGVFKTSSAMDTLRQTFTRWAGVTAEQSKLVTDQQMKDLERGTTVYQSEYEKRQQIVAGFYKAIADAEEDARIKVAEGVMMGGGPIPTLPFATDIATAQATREATAKQVAGMGRFDKLSTDLERARAQLQAVEKAYADLTEQMIKMPTLETSAAFMKERTELEKQALTLRADVKAMEDKAEADKKAEAAATSLADREVDLQLRYQARNIALKAGTEAAASYEDRTNSMTEAEQRAEAHHLRRSSAINAENRELERAAKRTKEWTDIEDDLNRAYDRATMSAAQLLEQRMKLAGVPPARQEELLYLQEQTEIQDTLNTQIKARDGFVSNLQESLQAVNLALAEGLTLEEATKIVEMDRLTATDAGLETLVAQNEQVEKRLALYRARRGEGTAGLGPEEAIETFRQRGMTQGVVEGEPGPIEQRMTLVTTATSRFATELQQARLDLLALGGPDVVQTFDDLTIKRFGAATEGLYEFQDGLFSIRDAAEEVSGAVLSALQRLTEGGKTSFKELATSIVQDLLSILQQKVLLPQLTRWTELALSAGLNLLKVLGGGAGAGVGGALSAATIAAGGGTPGLQHGGPLQRGLTLVGEAGPEVIAAEAGRAMVYPTSHPLTQAALRETRGDRRGAGSVPGSWAGAGLSHPMAKAARAGFGGAAWLGRRQYGGPLPSAVMGVTGSTEALAQPTMTSGGQGAGITQNFYITTNDAQSFVRSKGEIQRQMLNAFRASQRS